MNCSPPGFAVHGTLQARTLEPVAIVLPNPGMETPSLASPALAGVFFTTSITWEEASTYIHLWLIHVGVWQKFNQYCKAFILQLKINKFKYIYVSKCKCVKIESCHFVKRFFFFFLASIKENDLLVKLLGCTRRFSGSKAS